MHQFHLLHHRRLNQHLYHRLSRRYQDLHRQEVIHLQDRHHCNR